MLKSQIKPESCYEFVNMSRADILNAYNERETITGYVESILSKEEKVIVKLGEGIFATLPFEETTMYPFSYSQNFLHTLPKEIYTLRSRNIRIKVTSVDGDNIIVSRKENMIEACDYLAKCTSVLFHITGLKATLAFGDIGDGIPARLSIKDVCKSRLQNIAEYFHINDCIWVNIIGENEDKKFFVSYKDTFPPFNPKDYQRGDVYVGKICQPIDNENLPGYYIDISPNVSGILDITPVTPLLRYGDKVECTVRRADERGLKLRFLRKLM